MKVLFYSPSRKGGPKGKVAEEILGLVSPFLLPQEIEICRSLQDLDVLLLGPGRDYAGAVLDASGRGSLQDLVARRDLLADLKTVLIAPSCQGKASYRLHLLRPRFIVCSRAEVKEAASAVLRMVKR